VLDEGGLEAVSLASVAEASRTHKASIGYYFGNKNGLLAALADSIMLTDDLPALPSELKDLTTLEARVARFVDEGEKVACDPDTLRSYFALLPQGLRNDELRAMLADHYDDYLLVQEELLRVVAPGTDPELLLPLASLGVAIIDGLSVQAALRPSSENPRRALALWGQMLTALLESRDSGPQSPRRGPVGGRGDRP
jgi:AcrR family transcriptional regulator